MSAETLGADLLREVKEEGLDDVRGNIQGCVPVEASSMFLAYTDRLSSFYVLYKTSKHIPNPDSGFRLWTESSMSSKILLSRGNSNNITCSGPLNFGTHSKRRREQKTSHRRSLKSQELQHVQAKHSSSTI